MDTGTFATTLSAAAGMLRFLDLGIRLLSQSTKTYYSVGSDMEKRVSLGNIAIVVEDLVALLNRVRGSTIALDEFLDAQNKELHLVRAECEAVGSDLLGALEALGARGATRREITRRRIRASLRSTIGEATIKALVERMTKARSQALLSVIPILIRIEQLDPQGWVDFLERESKPDHRDELSKLPRAVAFAEICSHQDDPAKFRTQWLETLWDSEWQSTSPIQLSGNSNHWDDRKRQLSMWLSQTFRYRLTSTQASGQEETVKWLWKGDHPSAVGFVKWLEGMPDAPSDCIYWVTGSNGSGKSTLMNKLYDHRVFKRKLLAAYAEAFPVIIARHFFRRNGADIDRSWYGLLRNILAQYTSQLPRLASIACPRRLALFPLFRTNIASWTKDTTLPDWTERELDDAIDLVVSQNLKLANIVLFIDGLDEADDPVAVTTKLQRLVSASRIKLCVSSYPSQVFRDAFGASSSVIMENMNLTQGLMRSYVHNMLGSCTSTRGLHAFSLGGQDHMESMEAQMIAKSQGSFLWVELVLRSLGPWLLEEVSLSYLQDRINELPEGVDKLTEMVWNMLESRTGSRSSELIQMHRAAHAMSRNLAPQDIMSAESYAKAGDSASRMDLKMMAYSYATSAFTTTEGLLNSMPNCIDYRHPIVEEALHRQHIWERILAAAPTSFDPFTELCRSGASQFAMNYGRGTREQFWEGIFHCLGIASYAAADTADKRERLEEVLDDFEKKVIAVIHSRATGPATGLGEILYLPHRDPCDVWTRSTRRARDYNSYLDLVTHCRVLPYVKAKLLRDPDLIGNRATYIALNESVLNPLGLRSSYGKHTSSNAPPVTYNENLTSKALNFIQFVLEHATTPTRKVELARFLRVQTVSAKKRHGDWIPAHHWDSVEKVLSEAVYSEQEQGKEGEGKATTNKSSVKKLTKKLKLPVSPCPYLSPEAAPGLVKSGEERFSSIVRLASAGLLR